MKTDFLPYLQEYILHPLMVLGHASHQNYALAHELNSKLPFAVEFVIPVNQNGIYNNSYDRITLFLIICLRASVYLRILPANFLN